MRVMSPREMGRKLTEKNEAKLDRKITSMIAAALREDYRLNLPLEQFDDEPSDSAVKPQQHQRQKKSQFHKAG